VAVLLSEAGICRNTVIELNGKHGGGKMPNITIDGPVIRDVEKRRVLVREITDAAEKAYGIRREAFVVIIRENPQENVAVGGELLSDRKRGK
jgi:4-oxalocrotonate tautomerase